MNRCVWKISCHHTDFQSSMQFPSPPFPLEKKKFKCVWFAAAFVFSFLFALLALKFLIEKANGEIRSASLKP